MGKPLIGITTYVEPAQWGAWELPSALIAAGLDGIERGAEPPPPLEGNAYESDAERFPHSLRDAITALEQGTFARRAFGDDVVDHYLNYARIEQELFDRVVTGYERERFYERG